MTLAQSNDSFGYLWKEAGNREALGAPPKTGQPCVYHLSVILMKKQSISASEHLLHIPKAPKTKRFAKFT